MIKRLFSKISLIAMMILIIYFAIATICTLMALVCIALIKLNVLDPHFYLNSNLGIAFLFFVSIAIVAIVALVMNKMLIKPLFELFKQMKKLSKGDFSVRYNVKGFFKLNELSDFSTYFNETAEELGSIELLRNNFINDFSHEFKTPIVSLRGFAKLLKNENLSVEEKNEYLDIIISESDRLAELSTSILNLSKIENKRSITQHTKFNLSEQVRKCILLLERKWSAKHLNLNIDLSEIFVSADEPLLSQVWVNILTNAIKFSKENGEIKIKSYEDNGEAVIIFSDSGCGMSEEVKNHMFEKFYQGDSSHAEEGNGIGMAVVKKIVELHDGEIIVHSDINVGTSFTVLLPL